MKILVSCHLLFLILSCASTQKSKQQTPTYEYLEYSTPTFDQAKIGLYLFLPEGDSIKNAAVVIADDFQKSSRDLMQLAENYRRKGYTSLLLKYRTEYDSLNNDSSLPYFSNEFTIDMMTAVAWVKQNVGFDYLGLHTFDRSSLAAGFTLAKVNLDFCILQDPVLTPPDFTNLPSSDSSNYNLLKQFPAIFNKSKTPIHSFLTDQQWHVESEQTQAFILDSPVIKNHYYSTKSATKKKNPVNIVTTDSLFTLLDELTPLKK